jgi:hypothetical protein
LGFDKSVVVSVADPYPELIAGSGYGSAKNNSGYGSGQLRIRNEFEVKLLPKKIIKKFPGKLVVNH